MTVTLGPRAWENALCELAEDDERIVVMTAENRAELRGAQGRLGARFIDTGITEQTLVGSAAGLALRGRIPVIHALAAFLTMRAFEFCRTDVGIAGLPVKLVGFIPGFLSDGNGPTHQAIEDIGLMRLIPGMRVFSPSDTHEMVAALPAVIADPHPWYIRSVSRPAVAPTLPFEIGRAVELRPGSELTILTHGLLATTAAEVADELTLDGISARVVHMRTLAPVDESAIDAALTAGLCVTLEDHLSVGGLRSIVAERALATGVAANHLGLDFPAWFRAGRRDEAIRHAGFAPEDLARRITERMEQR